MDNEQKVLAALTQSEKPMSAKEIAEASGVDKKDVDKIIKKLKDNGKLISPKRCYYQIN
jgi:DNA-binding MarR family transcriptional regulator